MYQLCDTKKKKKKIQTHDPEDCLNYQPHLRQLFSFYCVAVFFFYMSFTLSEWCVLEKAASVSA